MSALCSQFALMGWVHSKVCLALTECAPGCPSGQRERTVNPSAFAYRSSNLLPGTNNPGPYGRDFLYAWGGCIQIAWGRQRPDPGPEVRETYAADRTGLYQARGVPHPGPERRSLTCLGQHRAGLRKRSCARYMATSAAKGAAGRTRPSAT